MTLHALKAQKWLEFHLWQVSILLGVGFFCLFCFGMMNSAIYLY